MAKIEILDRDEDDFNNGLLHEIEVQFNPNQYTLAKSAQYAEIGIPGLDAPVLQFVRGQNEKLTLDLFFDVTRSKDSGDKTKSPDMSQKPLVDLIKPFYQLIKIQPKTHAPPRIKFSWGGYSFKAVIESIQRRYTLFDSNGVPLRATLGVTMSECKSIEDQLRDLKLESSDHTKCYLISKGDTLSRIAAREYGDPGLWRHIANHRDNRQYTHNPRRLQPGIVLTIPPLKPGASQ